MQYTKVAAPVAGIVSKRNVEPGQVVQAGQPMFAIVNLEDIYVTANFKETQLKKMKPGQRVRIHVDAYGRDYGGVLESIGGATGARFSLLPPENATGNYVKGRAARARAHPPRQGAGPGTRPCALACRSYQRYWSTRRVSAKLVRRVSAVLVN